MTAPGAPRRVTVQVWPNSDGDGFTGYVPQTGTEVTAPTFDQAHAAALAACRNHPEQEDPPMRLRDQAEPRWTCNNGHDNPPGRTDCATCGTPML